MHHKKRRRHDNEIMRMGNSNEEKYYTSYAYWIASAKALDYCSVDTALLTLYLEQYSISSISKKFFTRQDLVRKHLHRILPQERKFYKRYQKLYPTILRHGYTSVDKFFIAHQHIPPIHLSVWLGIHAATVRNHFHRLGLKVKPPGGANNPKGGKVKYYYEGIPLKQWCQHNEKNYSFIMYRINHGWDIEQAIVTPKLKPGRST